MKLSLIGMSGAGKSLWAEKLKKEKGFQKYSIDELIEKYLEGELEALGYSGVNGLSLWMGQPCDLRYEKTSRKYLELEEKKMSEVLDIAGKNGGDMVIDTTGSVIHLNEDLLRRLKKLTNVIYLETPKSIVGEMIKKYVADPKPVIWGNLYKPRPNESHEAVLKRSYPELLKYRTELYEKLADVTVGYGERRKSGFNVDDLINLVRMRA